MERWCLIVSLRLGWVRLRRCLLCGSSRDYLRAAAHRPHRVHSIKVPRASLPAAAACCFGGLASGSRASGRTQDAEERARVKLVTVAASTSGRRFQSKSGKRNKSIAEGRDLWCFEQKMVQFIGLGFRFIACIFVYAALFFMASLSAFTESGPIHPFIHWCTSLTRSFNHLMTQQQGCYDLSCSKLGMNLHYLLLINYYYYFAKESLKYGGKAHEYMKQTKI